MGDSEQNYTTGLAHLLLCGTSGWALKNTSFDAYPFLYSAFTFLLGHGFLGIIRYTHPNCNKSRYYRYIFDDVFTFISTILPLPLLNLEIYLEYQQSSDFLKLSLISSIVILAIMNYYFIHTTVYNYKLSNIIILLNILLLAFISIKYQNYWAFGLSSMSLINFYIIQKLIELFSVPKVDLFTVSLAFFNIFAVNCFN